MILETRSSAHHAQRLRDVLRREQFTALAARTVVTASSSIATCIAVVMTFWTAGRHGFLLSILGVLLLLHGVALLRSRAWLRGPRTDLSGLQLLLRIAVTVLIASSWAWALFVLMPVASIEERQLLVYVFAGLTTSSLLIAPVLPAAIAMAGITSAAMMAVIPFVDGGITVQHMLTMVVFLIMTSAATLAQNRDFRRRVENEVLTIEQKDTIALLLKDFEEDSSDWLWSVDEEFRLHGSLGRFCAVTGCDAETLASVDLRSFLDRTGAWSADAIAHFLSLIEMRVPFREMRVPFRFQERSFWFCLSGRPIIEDDHFLGYRGVASNVTEAQRSSDRIAYLARYDSLTGLSNRTLFRETLQAMQPEQKNRSLLCLDLDGFKPVNDTYGHGVGDELLVMVADRLRAGVGEGDTVSRLGGDEFAILALNVGINSESALADRLIAAIAKPFVIRDIRVSISLSIGIVLMRGDESPEQLMQAGDIALYVSKGQGRGTWSVFKQSMADAAHERHLLQADLRDAIQQGGLSVAFQPIVDVRSRRVTCVEALVRWNHPTRGMIPPDRFIPLAEDNGLILTLGAWVLQQACLEAATWDDDVRIAVNLSPLQLRDPALLSTVDAALAKAGLPARRLEIEITESVFLDDVETTLDCLRALRARGIRISLDDFGTGYSSLSYLRSFPFDKVKIDRSFVRDIGESRQALSIVKAIVGMAGSLDMDTTGEGVETHRQADMLEVAGCDQFQGYLFSRPCNREDIGLAIRTCNETSSVAAE